MEIICNCGERRFEVPVGENIHCPRCGRAYTGVEEVEALGMGPFTPIVKPSTVVSESKKPKKGKIITKKGRLSPRKEKIIKRRRKND